jgi:hypothetical protein
MPAGTTIKHKRKAGAFANGELAIGELGLDITNSVWYYSTNGTTVVSLLAAVLAALALKAPLADPAFTGNPTVPTQTAGNNTTRAASTAFVATAIANLINSAPGALDTLEELADALGDDANFAATMTAALAGKQATSEKDQPDGYAGLDSDGKIAANAVPPAAKLEVIMLACSDADTALDSSGDPVVCASIQHFPYTFTAADPDNAQPFRAVVKADGIDTDADLHVDIKINGTSIFIGDSFIITKSSRTWLDFGTPVVHADPTVFNYGDVVTVEYHTTGTAWKNLQVYIVGYKSS